MIRFTSFIIIALFSLASPARAADITLTLQKKISDGSVDVSVINDSSVAVLVRSVYIELGGRRYERPVNNPLPPGEQGRFAFDVAAPSLPGSYALVIGVRYVNDGKTLSMKHAGLYHSGEPAPLEASCRAEDASMGEKGKLTVRSSRPELFRLVLPEEVSVLGSSVLEDRAVFRVRGGIGGFRNSYRYFAAAEEVRGGRHYAALCGGTLRTGAAGRGRMPSGLLFALSVVFLLLAAFTISKTGRLNTALSKYSSRMFLLCASYFLLKNLDAWLYASMRYIKWKPYLYIARISAENLRGGNYGYFFAHFIDPYLALCLFLALPFLYRYDSDKSALEDKYASLLKFLFSLPAYPFRRKLFYGPQVKLGFLTLMVKLFFVPLLVSWVINNTIHQRNLTASFRPDLYTINAYLVALFIYADTSIFCFGYLFEFGTLRNRIKSVEPTLLGWLVCLWCYPPFNQFSFRIFDHRIIDIARTYPLWVNVAMTCLITLLWGVFAWASLALGFRASNLTNRGIVGTGRGLVVPGPYRFVRHPAYAAKLLIWYIQGIFLGRYFIGMLLGLTLIYALRAWTEERHLAKDPDYVAYRKAVPWKFIPKVF